MADWINIKDKPCPENQQFDAWCVHPVTKTMGIRFTDVMMRGDGSGFGFIVQLPSGVHWEYIESSEGIYPRWLITHWREIPEGPEEEKDN